MRDYLYRVVTDQQGGRCAGFIRFILLILSFFYRGVVAVRNFFYRKGILRSVDLGKIVISVGNITWGGVGKTPFVILLVKHLHSRGFNPAVLTRGYMKNAASSCSDEAAMMRQYIPGVAIGVGGDRIQASKRILSVYPVDVFILDDGFQHRRVRRHLEIVLVDSANPFGNGQLIPAGILREPLSALKRAHIIVLTKSDFNPSMTQVLEERIRRINPVCVIGWAAHAPQALEEIFSGRQEPLAYLRDCKIFIFCAVGDPQSFTETLLGTGAVVEKGFVFQDHYVYSAKDIRMMVEQAEKSGVRNFVTTAKDAIKVIPLKEHFGICRFWVLKIEIELRNGKDKVFGRIDHLLGR